MSLSRNELICVSEWMDARELIRVQTLSKTFYDEVVPIVFYRNKIYLKLWANYVHWFKYYTKDIYFYDVLAKQQFKHQIDQIIPKNCKTISIGFGKIMMVGGWVYLNFNLSKAWEYNIRNKSMTQKNDMHQARR